MFDGGDKTTGLCDICDYRGGNYFKLGQRLCNPRVMDDNGNWIDGYSREKVKRSKEAFAKAEEQLRKTVIRFYTGDGDGGQICIECLKKIMGDS